MASCTGLYFTYFLQSVRILRRKLVAGRVSLWLTITTLVLFVLITMVCLCGSSCMTLLTLLAATRPRQQGSRGGVHRRPPNTKRRRNLLHQLRQWGSIQNGHIHCSDRGVRHLHREYSMWNGDSPLLYLGDAEPYMSTVLGLPCLRCMGS